MKKYLLAVILAVGLLLPAFSVRAETPMDMVKENVNKVLDVLRNKSLSRDAKIERLEKIYEVMFDEVELSKRSLGRNWKKLNPEQQKEFIPLFRQILENAYINRILSYTNEKIEFQKENKLSENQAEVQTSVITQSKKVPIYYRVIKTSSGWRVYDVIIENVSLVQNYRTQFTSILQKDSPDQLIETVRKRAKEKSNVK